MTLSSPLRFSTKIPFPQSDASTAVPPASTAATGQIDISACSEYTKYHTFVDYFKKKGQLRLIHDAIGKPVVFVINKDEQLCVLQAGVKQCEGWSCTNITPKGFVASTYDVVVATDQLFVAVACGKLNDTASGHQLFFVEFPLSQLDDSLAALEVKDETAQIWKLASDNRTNPTGSLTLSSVRCMVNGPLAKQSTKFQAVIGTEAANKRIATLYTVDPNAEPGEYWSVLTYPAAASAIAQVEPLVLGQPRGSIREIGLLSRFIDFANIKTERLAGHIYAKEGGIVRNFEMKTAKLGDVRSAFSHLNYMGLTDILVAGEKGIGFYSYGAIDVLAVDPILPNKSFIQVFASEAADPQNPMRQSKIALFALSDDRSLYYIEGTRNFETRAISFQQSGIPIREGVSQMSTMYSASYGTSELLYTLSGSDSIRYMRRNSAGSLWTEDDITFKSRISTKFDAYVTSITLTDSLSKNPATNFPVSISSENIHVAVNGTTYILSPKPTTLFTDSKGSLTVVIPSNKDIGCPALTLSVTEAHAKSSDVSQFVCEIEPSGRVDRLLNSIRTPDDLKNATSSSNAKPFQSMDPKMLESAAGVLQNYREARSALMGESGSKADTPATTIGDVSSEEPNFWQKIKDSTIDFLGDAIEFLKTTVKTAVKVIVTVAGPVVRLLLKVAGKWVAFHVKALHSLLSIIGTCLKDVFGFDGVDKLLEYCRLAVDRTSIMATQKVIKSVVMGSIELTGRFFDTNHSSVADLYEDGAHFLQSYIDHPKEAPKKTEESAIIQAISDVLNNPFIKLIMKINPVLWIVEAIVEEMPGIQVPDVDAALDAIKDTIGGATIKEMEVLDQAISTIITQVQPALSDASQFFYAIQHAFMAVFRTISDSLRNLTEGIVGIVNVVLQAIGTVVNGVWKIPDVTDLWEDFAGQEFSILNFFTFGPAVLIHFVSIITNGAPPFQNKQFAVDFSKVEIEPFYSSRRKNEVGEKATLQVSNSSVSQELPLIPPTEKSSLATGAATMAEAIRLITSGRASSAVPSSKTGNELLSEWQAQQEQRLAAAGFKFPILNVPSENMDMVRGMVQMIKYFAFAADNSWTVVQTMHELPQTKEQPEAWLSFFKLAGNFLASLMLFMQGLPDPNENMDFGHGVAAILGMGGVSCAAYAFIAVRKRPLHLEAGEEAHLMQEQQLQTTRMMTEVSRWLGWIATALQVVQMEQENQSLTRLHLVSPVLSASAALAVSSDSPLAGARDRAVIAVLTASLFNNISLGAYHGVTATKEI